jgi:ubiquinol-cytochrome c reductase iron-sulfur subunit
VKLIITLPNDDESQVIDEKRRFFLKTSVCAMGGFGALCALAPLFSSWMPNAKARLAGAALTVDLASVKVGQLMVVQWRGQPVWIMRRSPQMLSHLKDDKDYPLLLDPDSHVAQQPEYAKNKYRSINPEVLVLIGLCTHFGCSPKYKPDDIARGFYCPCHGSRFDLSGRVFRSMPAPVNMKVPPYRYLDDHTIVIGENE